jgi:folylpolyglutamate synthase/dihydropteroate synthase
MAVDRVAAVRPELKGESHDTPVAALLAVLDEAEERDVVWVGGSLFVVGDVLRDAPGVIPRWPNDDGSVT